jgi:VWFA-related protein
VIKKNNFKLIIISTIILGLLLLLLLNGCSLFKQYGSLEGYVYVPTDNINKEEIILRDTSQAPTGYKPLSGARISVQDFYKYTFSNIYGYFLLEDIVAGPVNIFIEPPVNSGYNALTTQAIIEPDTIIPIGTYGAVSLPSEGAGYWDISINQIDDSAYPEVKAYVSAIDPGNNIPIVGAISDNFELEINGIKINNISVAQNPGEISYPASISLVIDRSGSMEGEYGDDQPLDDAKAGAKTFVNLMGSFDRAEVISFGDDATIDQSFTSDKQVLYNAIDSLYSDGATALYDAIWLGLYDTAKETNSRKAVIALTDGGENNSSSDHGGGDYNFSDGSWSEYPDNSLLINYANSLDIPVYTIGLQGFNFTREEIARSYTTTEADLKEIADKTGGVYKYAATSEYLEYIYEEIKQRIEQQYIITFTDNTGITEGYLTVKLNYNQMYGEDTKDYNPPAQEYENKVEVYGTYDTGTVKVYEDHALDANVIGKKYWGSIGTVIDGPVDADGKTWKKVKWDNDENVPGETGSYYKPESGWSKADYLWEYDIDKKVRGVDVSQNNTITNWADINNSGRKFAFIRVNRGGGDCWLDYGLEQNINGAIDANMYISFYHWAKLSLDAEEEAKCFCKLTEDYDSLIPNDRHLIPALDIEGNTGINIDGIEYEKEWEEVALWIHTWMKKVKEINGLDKFPILYCNKTVASELVSADSNITDLDYSIIESPLWIVDWSNNEDPPKYGWSDWAFRQYAGALNPYEAGRGRCPGFAEDAGVDLDIFNGTIDDLESDFLIK